MWSYSRNTFGFKYYTKVQDYNPIQLINVNMDILKGDVEISEVIKSLYSTLGASVLFVISSIVVFCKKEI